MLYHTLEHQEIVNINIEGRGVYVIHRPYMYKPDKHDPTEAQWIIGKNRFGRLGRIQFRWTAELTKYEEEQNYPVTNK